MGIADFGYLGCRGSGLVTITTPSAISLGNPLANLLYQGRADVTAAYVTDHVLLTAAISHVTTDGVEPIR